jgi:beta-carotene hydroxylase
MVNKSIKTNRESALSSIPELKEVIKAPKIAWPTVTLFFVVIALFIASTTAGIQGIIPVWCATLLNGFFAYASFTVLHDASHHAVSRIKWINEACGWISLLFLGPMTLSFKTFRFIHIQHHRFTNDPKNDPDFWVSLGPSWIRPLMLASIDINYIRYYFPLFLKRPKNEIISVFVNMTFTLSIVAILLYLGYGWDMLFYWIIPSRIALFFLALGLDYLPHYPHKVSEAENPYQATSIREGGAFFWSALLIYQNYHLAHHLYPTAPFYRYKKVWRVGHEYFMSKKPYILDAFGRRKQ